MRKLVQVDYLRLTLTYALDLTCIGALSPKYVCSILRVLSGAPFSGHLSGKVGTRTELGHTCRPEKGGW